MIDKAEPIASDLGHSNRTRKRGAAGVGHEADGVKGRCIGVFGEVDGDSALAKRLLHSLENRIIETLNLLGRRMAAEESRQLGAVVPGLGAAGGDGGCLRVRAATDVDKGLRGCQCSRSHGSLWRRCACHRGRSDHSGCNRGGLDGAEVGVGDNVGRGVGDRLDGHRLGGGRRNVGDGLNDGWLWRDGRAGCGRLDRGGLHRRGWSAYLGLDGRRLGGAAGVETASGAGAGGKDTGGDGAGWDGAGCDGAGADGAGCVTGWTGAGGV